MTQMQKTVLRVALAALGLLMAPLIASPVVDGWNWSPGAFVFTSIMFFGTGMAPALFSASGLLFRHASLEKSK